MSIGLKDLNKNTKKIKRNSNIKKDEEDKDLLEQILYRQDADTEGPTLRPWQQMEDKKKVAKKAKSRIKKEFLKDENESERMGKLVKDKASELFSQIDY